MLSVGSITNLDKHLMDSADIQNDGIRMVEQDLLLKISFHCTFISLFVQFALALTRLFGNLHWSSLEYHKLEKKISY